MYHPGCLLVVGCLWRRPWWCPQPWILRHTSSSALHLASPLLWRGAAAALRPGCALKKGTTRSALRLAQLPLLLVPHAAAAPICVVVDLFLFFLFPPWERNINHYSIMKYLNVNKLISFQWFCCSISIRQHHKLAAATSLLLEEVVEVVEEHQVQAVITTTITITILIWRLRRNGRSKPPQQ